MLSLLLLLAAAHAPFCQLHDLHSAMREDWLYNGKERTYRRGERRHRSSRAYALRSFVTGKMVERRVLYLGRSCAMPMMVVDQRGSDLQHRASTLVPAIECSRERCVQSGNHCIASMLGCHCDLFCATVTEVMSRPYWWPRPPPIYWEHQARRWCIIVTRALLQRARRRQKNGSDGSRRERPTISTVHGY